MTVYKRSDLIARAKACVAEAVAPKKIDFGVNWLHVQAGKPYMNFRLRTGAFGQAAEDIYNPEFTLEGMLVVAHLQESNVAQTDDYLNDRADEIDEYFAEQTHRMFVSAAYPDEPAYLDPEGVVLQSDTGWSSWQQIGLPQSSAPAQIGAMFTWRGKFLLDIY